LEAAPAAISSALITIPPSAAFAISARRAAPILGRTGIEGGAATAGSMPGVAVRDSIGARS
jgi:hypothetical protein